MLRFIAAIVTALVLSNAHADEPALPQTPAGHAFAMWLNGFNDASRAELSAFMAAYHRHNSVDSELHLRRHTGGFEILEIPINEPRHIGVVVKERDSDQALLIKMNVATNDDMTLSDWTLEGSELPKGHEVARMKFEELEQVLNDRLQSLTQRDLFSGVVLVAHHGEAVYSYAGGRADREFNVPVARDTRFRMGSMNKMFTAVAILQLVDAGKLHLDDTVGLVLPNYANADVAAKVTVRELLDHTGGTGDIFGAGFTAHRLELRTLQDYTGLFSKRAPEFEPGTQDGYSNFGYILLGRIVEVVSGEDYFTYVRRHIFVPANMASTGDLPEEEVVPRRALPYTPDEADTQWLRADDTLPWRATSAGGGYTTVDDLVNFATALKDGRLVSQRLLTEATLPQNHAKWYGFGFMVGGTGAERTFGHDGGAPGMEGSLVVVPEGDWTIVGLGNFGPGPVGQLVQFIAKRVPL